MRYVLVLLFALCLSVSAQGQVIVTGSGILSGTGSISVSAASSSSAPFLLGGTGWTVMTNTNLQVSQGVNPATAICPPNNYNSSGYSFTSACYNEYIAWG